MRTLLGKKLGMTAIFTDDGRRVPVTVIEAGPCTVTQKKTVANDGYTAFQIGYGEIEQRKLTKPMTGHFGKKGIEPKRYLREVHPDPGQQDRQLGEVLEVGSLFEEGHFVDVVGTSKGRGFSGVMKRHGFAGKNATHGTHECFRHGGSLGPSAWPSRVFKGIKMAGQYGNTRVTIQNLRIVRINADENLLMVKGGIPGPRGGLVMVSSAKKKENY